MSKLDSNGGQKNATYISASGAKKGDGKDASRKQLTKKLTLMLQILEELIGQSKKIGDNLIDHTDSIKSKGPEANLNEEATEEEDDSKGPKGVKPSGDDEIDVPNQVKFGRKFDETKLLPGNPVSQLLGEHTAVLELLRSLYTTSEDDGADDDASPLGGSLPQLLNRVVQKTNTFLSIEGAPSGFKTLEEPGVRASLQSLLAREADGIKKRALLKTKEGELKKTLVATNAPTTSKGGGVPASMFLTSNAEPVDRGSTPLTLTPHKQVAFVSKRRSANKIVVDYDSDSPFGIDPLHSTSSVQENPSVEAATQDERTHHRGDDVDG